MKQDLILIEDHYFGIDFSKSKMIECDIDFSLKEKEEKEFFCFIRQNKFTIQIMDCNISLIDEL